MEEKSFQQKLWIWIAVFLKGARPLLWYILMPALSMSLGYVLFHSDMDAVEFFSYGSNFYTAVGMLLTIYVLYRGSRKRGHRFFEDASLYLDQLDWKKCAAAFGFGIAMAVAVSSAITLLPRWGITNDYSDASQNMFRGRDVLFTIVTTVLTAPLAEEIVFRGYMLNTFLEYFDEKWSVVFVSAIFAVCHGELLWILYAFGMGAILAWVSVREDNICYGILLHIGFNLPSMVNWLIRASVPASQVLFEGWWMILAYGIAGGLVSVLIYRWYFRYSGIR